MPRSGTPSIGKVLLFLALFLGAQAATLAHETDLHAHAGGDSCEICLSGTGLGHAALPGGDPAPVPFTGSASLNLPVEISAVAAPTVVVPPCRGPPATSLS